ncbi:hypothetical protein [Parasitella parasitica]|uniref:Uncharacterized protein n=1 Tax=Parasitella parasitica TaxID=35722 RepID=A0A0B7NGY8_9FUNG|nr:hypothetical protein [Parasitella parasitica]
MSTESSTQSDISSSDLIDQLELVREETKGLNLEYEMLQNRLRAIDTKLKKDESLDKELAELKAEDEQSKTQLENLKQKVEKTLSLTEELEEKGVLDDDATEQLLQMKIKEKLDLIASIKADVQKKKQELADLKKHADSS